MYLQRIYKIFVSFEACKYCKHIIFGLAQMRPVKRTKIYALIPALCLLWIATESYAGQFKVTRVTDGDTIKIDSNTHKFTFEKVESN